MRIMNFVGALVIAIIFGFMGIYFGEGFINYGSITMGLCSIPYLFI